MSIIATELSIEIFFREELDRITPNKTSTLLQREGYNKINTNFTPIESSDKKTPNQYYHIKKYAVIECGDALKLIRRRKGTENSIYFVTVEETYDIIDIIICAHIATGHGGRDKMLRN